MCVCVCTRACVLYAMLTCAVTYPFPLVYVDDVHKIQVRRHHLALVDDVNLEHKRKTSCLLKLKLYHKTERGENSESERKQTFRLGKVRGEMKSHSPCVQVTGCTSPGGTSGCASP